LRRDRRAYAGHRLDRTSPADERHALVHADETERTRTRCLRVASLPAVLDGHDRNPSFRTSVMLTWLAHACLTCS
jgi:hypothetical protein